MVHSMDGRHPLANLLSTWAVRALETDPWQKGAQIMGKFLLRWIISAAAILAATYLVPGITIEGDGILVALAMAFLLGLVNALIRPILVLLSCGCIVATLGLFMLVINTISLLLAEKLGTALGLGFSIDGYLPAFYGSLVISLVSWLLSIFLIGDKERK